ncbi:MAG: DUF1287 domain-containing protein [Actinobacteria bacterium]|nr:DUF1287 domain-containing protein [Actinomycetota bacterium]
MRRGNKFLLASIFLIAVIQLATLFFLYKPDAVAQQISEANAPPTTTTETAEMTVTVESVTETTIIEETTPETTAINTVLNETQAKILADAKKQVEERVVNKGGYYEGGYPPDSEGTAADVITRALKNSGIDLRELVYQDMLAAKDQYPWELYEVKEIDKNIDFRRTPNQMVFFKRNGLVLTNEFNKDDPENVAQWQAGDFVYFSTEGDDWAETCGIISDKRSEDGIPLVIHNTADPGYVIENDFLLSYKIVGHFRYPKP